MHVRECAGWTLALALIVALATDAAAQQGNITGRVVQSGTLRPLAGAQVSIPGSGRGALVNDEGRYLMVGVPVGSVSIRVQLIGFTVQERTVTVASGESVVVDFELATEALGLDEIVVTGTAGGVQRRAIGNVVGSVNLERVMENTAPRDVQQLIAGQVPGVTVRIGGGGNVGTSGAITIRGMSTLALNSSPLVFIDGVRSDRLNDLNVEEIERIEVIKGPAAATLYGTEASNGVIQVITKKGRPGVTTVDFLLRQGANWFNDPAGRLPTNYAIRDGQVVSQHLFLDEEAAGRNMFRYGAIQTYGVNVRGGRDNLTYFLSGQHEHEQGYMLNNANRQTSLRTNFQLSLTDDFDIGTDLGVIRSETTTQPDGTAGTTGLFSMLLWGNPLTKETAARGFMVGPPEVNYLIESRSQLHRATVSVHLTHRPSPLFTQRLVTGFDWSDNRNSTFHPRLPEGTPPFYAANSVGNKSLSQSRALNQTVDYSATLSLDVSPELTSATSGGLQYYSSASASGGASGRDMPTPAVSTVSAAAVTSGSESSSENKTFGVYVQQTFGLRNQAFLTAALRADANSAFGESFKAAYYPKLSGTWVISDASFFDVSFVENLRLRGAWGRSGLQPSTFAKFRTYSPTTGPGDAPTVSPGNLGNPDLKPEVGQELELGFDAGLFGNRVNVEFTHYRQVTRDLILSERVAPSIGFPGNRSVNAGEVRNWGYEVKLETLPIMTRSVELSLTAAASFNQNRLEDLQGREVAADTRGRWQHREGYPLGGMWTKYVVSAEWGANRQLVNVMCRGPEEEDFRPMPCAQAPFHYYGSPGPGVTGSLTQTLTIGNRVTFNAFWFFLADSRRFNTTEWYRDRTQRNSARIQDYLLGQMDPLLAATLHQADVEHEWYERDDFIRLRDVSVTYNLPSQWAARFGGARASVMVSGRNLLTFTHPSFRASGLDPETTAARNAPWPGWEQTRAPVPHSVVTTMRVTF